MLSMFEQGVGPCWPVRVGCLKLAHVSSPRGTNHKENLEALHHHVESVGMACRFL